MRRTKSDSGDLRDREDWFPDHPWAFLPECAFLQPQHLESELEVQDRTENDGHTPRILLAEDDDEMRNLLRDQLVVEGYEVVECTNGEELARMLSYLFSPGSEAGYDLVVSDVRMPVYSGLDVVRELRDRTSCPPIILISAFADEQVHAEANRLGVFAILDKPFPVRDLLTDVRMATGSVKTTGERTAHAPSADSKYYGC